MFFFHPLFLYCCIVEITTEPVKSEHSVWGIFLIISLFHPCAKNEWKIWLHKEVFLLKDLSPDKLNLAICKK